MTLLRALLLALATLAPLALPAQESAEAPPSPIQTQDADRIDADIAVRLRDILAELGGYEDVTVQVNEGIVTLRGTANSMAEATDLGDIAGRIEGVVSVRNQVTETADIARRLNPAVERFVTRLNQLFVALPVLAIAAAVFALVAFGGFRIARLARPWDRIAPNAFIADLYRQIVRIVFVVVGLVIALDILNATALLSTILGAAGLIGLAIGFAVRDTVENFIASVLLSVRQPFRPNDAVEIGGDTGKVIRLTSRATILLSFDGNHIRIPNATVFKSRILNYTTNGQTRFTFTLTVDPAADLARATELAADTVRALPFTLATPEVETWLGDLTDSGVQVTVAGWIDQGATSLLKARSEALRLVIAAFATEGITLTNTTYTIQLSGGDAAGPTGAVPPRPPAPPSHASVSVAENVEERTDRALQRLIDEERTAPDTEDLLRDDAAKE